MRTFVAVEITNESVIDSIKKIQSELSIKAKPVNPKNIHFTLQFLGEISESVNKEVQNALSEIEFESFDLSFIGVEAFPNTKNPRVVWIGTDDFGGKCLKKLANQVGNVLSPLGFKSDKPFKPHITIFRIKSKIGDITKDLEKYQNRKLGVQKITSMKFKKSVLTSNGPIYSDLLEVKVKN